MSLTPLLTVNVGLMPQLVVPLSRTKDSWWIGSPETFYERAKVERLRLNYSVGARLADYLSLTRRDEWN